LTKVFVDTSAFVALRHRSEDEHDAARVAMRDLASQGSTLFTTNYVFAETYTTLLVRAGRSEAIAWGRHFRASEAIELIRVSDEIEDEAWQLLEAHQDKTWSLVDAISFALMERERTRYAFAFDRHFRQRGLDVIPTQLP
jgi:predicted nucleic acid-binding protein